MKQPFSITAVVENTANRGLLLAEHGVSFWIEAGERKILFDTGQGMVLTRNAETLGVQLSSADAVVLSHGHYDHTGGLLAAMSQLGQATVYVHAAAFQERFTTNGQNGVRSVRSPIESLDWLTVHFRQVQPMGNKPVEISNGVWLTGEIPRRTDFEDVGGAFYLDAACTRPDPIVDDQALFTETSQGVVVVLGCAHAGVVNTLDYIRELTGNTRIHAVVGGMHLLNADERRMDNTIRRLRELDVQRIGLAHCTGFGAMARLYHELPGRCLHFVTSTRLEFH